MIPDDPAFRSHPPLLVTAIMPAAVEVGPAEIASEALQPAVDPSLARDRVDGGDLPWALIATAGVQCSLPCGRLGLGVQRTVAGALTDEATTLVVDVAVAIE